MIIEPVALLPVTWIYTPWNCPVGWDGSGWRIRPIQSLLFDFCRIYRGCKL